MYEYLETAFLWGVGWRLSCTCLILITMDIFVCGECVSHTHWFGKFVQFLQNATGFLGIFLIACAGVAFLWRDLPW